MTEHRLRILHISDLHERAGREADNFRRLRVLGREWERNLDELLEDGAIQLICFTGDLADWGVTDEYAAAIRFLDALLEHLSLGRDRLFLVPGNHDIQRKVEEPAWSRLRDAVGRVKLFDLSLWLRGGDAPLGVDDTLREQVLSRGAAYRDFLARTLDRADLLPERSAHGKLGYRATVDLGGYPFPIHVIGLDSAWLCGDNHDAGKLLLTDDQVGRLTTTADGKPLPGFRLALIHHPLTDLLPQDQACCERLLAENVDLLLRGHLHRGAVNTLVEPDRAARQLAAGCLYEGHLGDQHPNACHVIDAVLDGNGRPVRYDLRFRAWSRDGFWHDDSSRYRAAANGRLTWKIATPSVTTPSASSMSIAMTAPTPPVRLPAEAEAGPTGTLPSPPAARRGTLPPPTAPRRIPMRGLEPPPSLGGRFVGRDEFVTSLFERLKSRSPAEVPPPVVVTGPAGAGKTCIAAEFFWRYGASHFRGGLFWIDAADETTKNVQFHDVLTALLPETLPVDTLLREGKDLSTLVAQALRAVEEPVLWIIDNVPEPARGEAPRPLSYWCPASGFVSVLVTSRLVAQERAAAVVPLPPLSIEAAIEFLLDSLPGQMLSPEQAATIVEWVGRLPLALEMLNRTLALSAVTADELVTMSSDPRSGASSSLDRFVVALRGQFSEASLRGIGAAFQLSFERLAAAAQDLARVIAWMAPDPIPSAVISALGAVPDAVAALTARSFLVGAMGDSMGAMHALLAAFIRTTHSDRTEHGHAAITVLERLLDNFDYTLPAAWPLLRSLGAHATFCYSLRSDRTEIDFNAMLKVWCRLRLEGQVAAALRLSERITTEAETSLGSGATITLMLLATRLALLKENGQPGTVELRREIEQRIRAGHESGLLSAEDVSLVRSLVVDEDVFASIRMSREIFAAIDSNSAPGPQRAARAADRAELEAELRAIRSYSGADRELRVAALRGRVLAHHRLVRREFGDDDTDSLAASRLIGIAADEAGDSESAINVLARVWERSRRLLTDGHDDTARAALELVLASGVDTTRPVVADALRFLAVVLTVDREALTPNKRKIRERVEERDLQEALDRVLQQSPGVGRGG